jgi:hypothetical protein
VGAIDRSDASAAEIRRRNRLETAGPFRVRIVRTE